MQIVVCTWIVRVVTAGNEDHRQIFCIGTGNPIERGKCADVEGDNDRSRSVHTGVALSSIGCIQFVTTGDLLDILVP